MPLGLVLAPQLLPICIKNLYADLVCIKCLLLIQNWMVPWSVMSMNTFFREANRLSEWIKIWQMEHNVENAKSSFLLEENKNRIFLNSKRLKDISIQRDAGVLVHQSRPLMQEDPSANEQHYGVLSKPKAYGIRH